MCNLLITIFSMFAVAIVISLFAMVAIFCVVYAILYADDWRKNEDR